jgi:outer membrane biosynthesis protein TonB
MKPLRLNIAAVALVLLLGISLGCQHKKPVLVMPQQPPATAAPQPTPTPEPAAQAADQPIVPVPEPTPAEQPKTAEKTKPKHGQHVAAKKPPKKVVQAEKTEPPTIPMGQISPGPTPADSTHSQTSTDQLLQSAEANLNSITRQLSRDEEAMRAQIKEFITQSRKATTENDPARAHNLAVKARLLSDDLVKQR